MYRANAFIASGVMIAALLTSACADKVGLPPTTTTTTVPGTSVLSVTVTPGSVTLSTGDRTTLVAAVVAEAGVTDRTVTWNSSNPSVASVDANGVVTAVGLGTTTVRATSKANAGVTGAAAVTVTSAAPGSVPASAVFDITMVVTLDPANHEGSTKYTTVREVTVTRDGDRFVISGGAPWVTLTGTANADNTFTATGSGTVAGFPNVQVRCTGTLSGNTVSGTVVLGPGLPQNQNETLSLTGTKR